MLEYKIIIVFTACIYMYFQKPQLTVVDVDYKSELESQEMLRMFSCLILAIKLNIFGRLKSLFSCYLKFRGGLGVS